MKKKTTLLLVLAAVALTLAGCGGSGEGDGEAATPPEAVAEIETVKTMLDEALREYRAGDADAADTTVGNAYLEHFEQVEGPLRDRDARLMEKLEERVSTAVRDEIKAGAPVRRVAALIAETKRELTRAAEALRE